MMQLLKGGVMDVWKHENPAFLPGGGQYLGFHLSGQ